MATCSFNDSTAPTKLSAPDPVSVRYRHRRLASCARTCRGRLGTASQGARHRPIRESSRVPTDHHNLAIPTGSATAPKSWERKESADATIAHLLRQGTSLPRMGRRRHKVGQDRQTRLRWVRHCPSAVDRRRRGLSRPSQRAQMELRALQPVRRRDLASDHTIARSRLVAVAATTRPTHVGIAMAPQALPHSVFSDTEEDPPICHYGGCRMPEGTCPACLGAV